MREKRDSQDIRVHALDVTLLLPLIMEEFDVAGRDDWEDEPDDRLERWMKRLRSVPSAWEEVSDVYPGPATAEAMQDPASGFFAEYGEYLYFHPHVRDLLYVSRSDELAAAEHDKPAVNRSMRVLERTDWKRLTVEFKHYDPRTSHSLTLAVPFAIRQANLYLFDNQVAMAAVKLTATEELTLDQCLNLQDVLRRIFPPYLDRDSNVRVVPGRCPIAVTIDDRKFVFGPSGEASAEENRGRMQELVNRTDSLVKDREPPVAAWWEEFLQPFRRNAIVRDPASNKPLKPQEFRTVEQGELGLRYNQIQDDRASVFSYIAVNDVWAIKPADWARLAVVDDAGNSDWMPYSPEFMDYSDYCREFFYDRFFHSSGNPAEGANPIMSGTRWFNCGYGFGVVGNYFSATSDGELDRQKVNDFFLCDQTGMRSHFRHHYFKMGLVAHLLQASLLQFKRQISAAVEYLAPDSTHTREKIDFQVFRERLTEIERDFLRFRSQYWSPELSQQVQGQELFAMWTEHLRIQKLYDLISRELDTAAEILNRHQQDRQSVLLWRLTMVATFFLLATPIIEKSFEAPAVGLSRFWGVLGVMLTTSGVLLAGFHFRVDYRHMKKQERALQKRVWRERFVKPYIWDNVWLACGVVLGIVGLLVLWLSGIFSS